MDYLYANVKDATFTENTMLRRAFRAHLKKVADALFSIEWNDSGDGDDDEEKNIKACISPEVILDQAIKEAKETVNSLQLALAKVEAGE